MPGRLCAPLGLVGGLAWPGQEQPANSHSWPVTQAYGEEGESQKAWAQPALDANPS